MILTTSRVFHVLMRKKFSGLSCKCKFNATSASLMQHKPECISNIRISNKDDKQGSTIVDRIVINALNLAFSVLRNTNVSFLLVQVRVAEFGSTNLH